MPDVGAVAHLRFHATAGDYLDVVGDLTRRSVSNIALGTFFLTEGLVGFATGNPAWVVMTIIGLVIVSGITSVPIVLLTTRRRKDLFMTDIEVEADADGLAMSTNLASSKHAWAVYRRARETSIAFLLQPGSGATIFVIKRGSSPDELAAFRRVLSAAGLEPHGTDMWRLVLAGALGFIVALALYVGPRAIL